jgi:hypothetical protein
LKSKQQQRSTGRLRGHDISRPPEIQLLRRENNGYFPIQQIAENQVAEIRFRSRLLTDALKSRLESHFSDMST